MNVKPRDLTDTEAARVLTLLRTAADNLRDNHLPAALLRMAESNLGALRNAFTVLDVNTAAAVRACVRARVELVLCVHRGGRLLLCILLRCIIITHYNLLRF